MTTRSVRQRTAGASKKSEHEPLIERESEEERSATVRWTQRIESLAMVLIAGALFYHLDIANTLLFSPLVLQIPLYLGVVCSIVFACIFAYLSVYLVHVRGIKIDYVQWQVSAPQAIPWATAAMCLSFLCFTIALWPVWHLWTPFILLLEFFGLVALLSFF